MLGHFLGPPDSKKSTVIDRRSERPVISVIKILEVANEADIGSLSLGLGHWPSFLYPPLSGVGGRGHGKGELSDEKRQQGVGLGSESRSSNVIMGGPDIVVGEVTKIQGEQFLIKGVEVRKSGFA